MSSFSALNTALSALQYNRTVMDVAAGNVANVATDGYTRRRVESASAASSARVALWSRSTETGQGVRVTGLTRIADELLNSRIRREHGVQSYHDVRQVALARVEDGIGEPGDTGLSAMLDKFRSSWSSVDTNPTSQAARAQVLTSAASVVDAVRSQASNIEAEASDQRMRTLDDVTEVNTVVKNLASLNTSISAAAVSGVDTSDLLDSRDKLLGRLSELTGAVGTVTADGSANVTLGGFALVAGNTAGRLNVASGVTATGAADGSPLTFSVTDPSGTTSSTGTISGELGGVATLLNTTLPQYLTSLGSIVTDLANEVNALHQSGYDADGTAGTAFFTYSAADPLGTLAVAVTDPRKIAVSAVAGGGTDSGIADRLSKASGVEDSYQRLVSTFGTQVADVQRQATNQQIVTNQVDSAREQLAGVSIDEEMVNIVAAQRAYEAASRVMTTVDSMLDTLINRTGVTH